MAVIQGAITPRVGQAEHCNRAGTHETREMATKLVLAAEMVVRALDAGIETEWTTGDAA